MDAPLAVGSLLKGAALVPAALAAAAVLVLPTPRLRALAVLAALVLAPGLLLAQLAGAGTLDRIAARPLLVAAAAAVGLAAVAALAVLLARRPQALPLLALVALPFRLPLELGGQSANLLLPLYVVVAAGSLAYAVERLRPATADRAPPQAPPARIEIALAVALVLYAAQALYSTNVDEAVKNVVFFYVPFALLLRLLVTVPWTGRLVAACLGVAVSLAVVFVVVGFWEFATRQLLLNPKVIADNEFRSYFRVNSLFFDPSVYGRFLAMVMLALATVLVWSARRRTTVLAAAALGLLWAGLVLTFSQSSFVALMVGLAVVAALRWRLRAVLAAAGGAALAASGQLGGHMAFSQGVGVEQTAFDAGPEDWTPTIPAGELAEGAGTCVLADGTPVLLVRDGGTVHAIHNRCSHRGGPLNEGEIAGGRVTCPWHGSRFRLEDGAVEQGPATAPQPAFDVRERDGRLEVRRRA